MFWIIVVILAVIISAVIFMRVYPVFGSRPEETDLKDYAERAQGYFDGKVFEYPSEWEIDGVSSDNRISLKKTAPSDELPIEKPDFSAESKDDVSLTWFGHSSVMIQISGKNILIDPVFSMRSSPFQWLGPSRFTEPSVTVDELPDIDAVLITHDHYDHLDMETIKALEKKTAHYIVPLGIDKHIIRWIDDENKVTNLAWWESFNIDGLEIYCTPANHKSGRAIDNQQSTLFCSWVLKDENHQILQSGDTGYGAHFEEIHKRFGDFDLFLPDSGQYNKNWHYWHIFPEESAMAAETLGAKKVMPVHWGAFVLSDHGWDDSPERITKACEEKNIEVVTPKLCETMSLNNSENFHERWWRDYE
ncbi:MAG: MBL fold metallo-hydrolase [Firmicutes bacterium]|nr:MBL fold metallo-hydrolase [Bacillota bacterium]